MVLFCLGKAVGFILLRITRCITLNMLCYATLINKCHNSTVLTKGRFLSHSRKVQGSWVVFLFFVALPPKKGIPGWFIITEEEERPRVSEGTVKAQTWKWLTSCATTNHCPQRSYAAPDNCHRGWEMNIWLCQQSPSE